MTPVAILSFHSHSERSFLDDHQLALASGALRRMGVPNDLVCIGVASGDEAELDTIAAALMPYGVIAYERVWDRALVAGLRRRLAPRPFVWCRGEHELADPPADHVVDGNLRVTLPTLLASLTGAIPMQPVVDATPNLQPVLVNLDALPQQRVITIEGNTGCPYNADARANPVYAGVGIPAGIGRGCAFCVTGNAYERDSDEITAARVFTQIQHARTTAPEQRRLVLKDQRPFSYLPEVLARCRDAGLSDFALLMETRADWFLARESRFEHILECARTAGVRLVPFLVGIENFSQAELDRYNKGVDPETNVRFLASVWAWQERYPDTLDLSEASFGFVLLSPWTTMDDLHTNLHWIRRTRLHALRGRLLLSRVRLYPDTALYYLAESRGLLAERYERAGEDASRRYGYYPGTPWRFADPAVAAFAARAEALTERTGGRDEVHHFECLLEAFDEAADPTTVTVEEVLRRAEAPSLAMRLGRLLGLTGVGEPFADGFFVWRYRRIERGVELVVRHPTAGDLALTVALSPGKAQSRHYTVTTQDPGDDERRAAAFRWLTEAVVRNDR